jgi:hypothetical protein
MWFGNPREQLRMTREEKEWVDFHNEMRERIDAKKGEMERLLQSDIMKNVTHGLDMHGFKVSETREIFKEGSTEPFCGLGGGMAEGLDRATLMIAMFELYLEYAHAQEAKRHIKEADRETDREEETRRLDSRDLER